MRVLTYGVYENRHVPNKTAGSWNATLVTQDDLVLVASRGPVVRPRGILTGAIRTDAQVWEAVCRVNRLIQVPRGTSRLLNEEEKITNVSCVCLLIG